MKILLVAERAHHARAIRETLLAAGHHVVDVMSPRDDFVMGAQRTQPDALVIELAAPTRDLLHSLQMLSERQPMPIVVFIARSEERDIRVAVRAGVSAYVVDRLQPRRVVSVLEVAVTRFVEFQSLRNERDEAVARLSERRAIEHATGILMRRRELAEAAAYEELSKTARNGARRMHEVADGIIAAEAALAQQ